MSSPARASRTRASRFRRRGPSVLLVRPDHLGDVLLTLPTALWLRRALPSARLTYVVSSALVDVPSRCPAVDDVIGLPFPDIAGLGRPTRLPEPWASALAGHDAALVLRPHDPWSGELLQRAGVPLRVGFPQAGTLPHLTEAVPEPSGHHALLGLHLADRLVRRVSPGTEAPVLLPAAEGALSLREADEREADSVLVDLPTSAARPIVLHPGAGWPLKRWGARRWGRLASLLHRRNATTPVVTGTPGETDLVDAVVEASGGRAVGLAGCLSLGGFAALLRRSRVVVAVDSGPLHLAAIVGAPVVGLYGPASPAEAGPLCPPERARLVGVELACRPCGQMVDPPCGARADPACIAEVTVDDVLSAACALLEPE